MDKKKPPKASEAVVLERIKIAASSGRYVIWKHGKKRSKERKVQAPDIELVLEKGRRKKARDRYDEDLENWSYALEGNCVDGEPLRVVVALLEVENLLIVTVVVLGGRDEE